MTLDNLHAKFLTTRAEWVEGEKQRLLCWEPFIRASACIDPATVVIHTELEIGLGILCPDNEAAQGWMTMYRAAKVYMLAKDEGPAKAMLWKLSQP